MSFSTELAALLVRDLTKVTQEIEAFPDDDTLWKTCPGISNSAGNLALHLEGNLREFIGRQIGGVAYTRQRDLEFSSKGLTRADVLERLRPVIEIVRSAVSAVTPDELDAPYPGHPLGAPLTKQQFLMHLHGHLNYHLGQIDYLRRFFTGQGAVDFVKLQA